MSKKSRAFASAHSAMESYAPGYRQFLPDPPYQDATGSRLASRLAKEFETGVVQASKKPKKPRKARA